MKPYRSLLFVPGHKPLWVSKALRAGTHAVILDLEDSVPEEAKAEAREQVVDSVDRLTGGPAGVIVRVNPLGGEQYGRDIAAVVRPGLTALLLPKVYGRDDIVAFDALVGAAEIEHGVPRGTVGLIPSLETAAALQSVHAIATASPRVVSVMTAAARDTDVAREVGFSWTREGLETLYLRSRVVLAARAAGLRHIVLGLWQDIADLDGLAAFARANRELGYGGQVIIHPSHADAVNRAYAPSAKELDRCRHIVRAYARARQDGSGAAVFEGEHIDLAHVVHARQVLEAEKAQ